MWRFSPPRYTICTVYVNVDWTLEQVYSKYDIIQATYGIGLVKFFFYNVLVQCLFSLIENRFNKWQSYKYFTIWPNTDIGLNITHYCLLWSYCGVKVCYNHFYSFFSSYFLHNSLHHLEQTCYVTFQRK